MLKVGDKAEFVGRPELWADRTVEITRVRPPSDGPWDYEGRGLRTRVMGVFHAHELKPIEETAKPLLPADAKERKNIPLASGVLDYFTAALVEVAKVSLAGNQQHNPGQPLHWARGKSTDQADTMLRHFVERGTLDADGIRHSAKMCWRALAILELELEAEGAPLARGAKEPRKE